MSHDGMDREVEALVTGYLGRLARQPQDAALPAPAASRTPS